MTRSTRDIAAPVEAVWAILADAGSYHRWVVGAREVRGADDGWPEAGSRFHHSVGWGPFSVRDDTKSLVAEPPRRLVMEARGRPLGRARVELVREAHDGGTRVTMEERVASPSLLRLRSPLLAPLVLVRNGESLRRLAALFGRGGA